MLHQWMICALVFHQKLKGIFKTLASKCLSTNEINTLYISDWLATMFISKDRNKLGILSLYKSSKIFYKKNIKCPLVSIYCDINTLGAVEHSKSQRNTWLCLVLIYDRSSKLQDYTWLRTEHYIQTGVQLKSK